MSGCINLRCCEGVGYAAMAIRFDFDEVQRILLARVDGVLTEELLTDVYRAIHQHSVETDARAGIFDFTSVTEFQISAEFVRRLARSEPAMPDVQRKPSMVIAPEMLAFGLARMFQIMGEESRPLFSVVRTMEEALAVLRVKRTDFKPIEPGNR